MNTDTREIMNGELIDKYYKGKCSPEEAKEVLQWFKEQNPGNKQEKDLYELWEKAGLEKDMDVYAHNTDKIFTNILSAIHEKDPKVVSMDTVTGRMWMYKFKIAVAVVISLCSLWVLANYIIPSKSLVVFEAGPGERKTITLEDGSVVSLNSESSIQYTKGLSGDERKILLNGEAFFDVAKDSLRPFIVQTGAIATQALGTSFNINYSDAGSEIVISLATGIVKVTNKEQENNYAILNPGDQFIYDPSRKQHLVKSFDMKEVLSWKDGVLYFRNSNLEQVIQKLEKWYAVDIEIVFAKEASPSDHEWNYTGEYNNESLENVLEGIGFVKNFTYTKKEGKIIIRML